MPMLVTSSNKSNDLVSFWTNPNFCLFTAIQLGFLSFDKQKMKFPQHLINAWII